jgi:protein-S-isoprenylcysteine O-methyltransferase Ste14
MNVDSAHKSRWAISEIVFGIPFLISLALHFVVPISLPQGIFRQVLIPIGIILAIAGIAMIVLARREFAYFSQPTDPGHPTSKIVHTGVFAISRNPIYLGCIFLILGVALTLNLLWALGMLLLSIVLCHYILIIPEEQYLAAKFGDEYKAYTDCVHRWLGRR